MIKASKILLGIGTFLPILFITIIWIYFFLVYPLQVLGEKNVIIFRVIPIGTTAIAVIIVVLLTYYIIQVLRNQSLDRDKKVLWIIGMLIGHIIALPIYFYLYIWKDKKIQKQLSKIKK